MAGQSFALREPGFSQYWPEYFRSAVENSNYVVVGDIIAQPSFKEAGWIWTSYSVRVRQVLKGEAPADSQIAFTMMGGRVGNVSGGLAEVPLYPNGRFLLFLLRADSNSPLRDACPDCSAEILGPSARTRYPPGKYVRADSLLERIRKILDDCSFLRRRDSADLILLGRPGADRLVPPGREVEVRVDSVLWRRRGVRFEGSSLSILYTSESFTPRFQLSPDGVYLLLIRRGRGLGWDSAVRWRIDSPYEAWCRNGDRAETAAGRDYHNIVASAPWDSLVRLARSRDTH